MCSNLRDKSRACDSIGIWILVLDTHLLDKIFHLGDVCSSSDEFVACCREMLEISILPGAYFRTGVEDLMTRRLVLLSTFFLRFIIFLVFDSERVET